MFRLLFKDIYKYFFFFSFFFVAMCPQLLHSTLNCVISRKTLREQKGCPEYISSMVEVSQKLFFYDFFFPTKIFSNIIFDWKEEKNLNNSKFCAKKNYDTTNFLTKFSLVKSTFPNFFLSSKCCVSQKMLCDKKTFVTKIWKKIKLYLGTPFLFCHEEIASQPFLL